MQLIGGIWTTITYVTNILTLSPISLFGDADQVPLLKSPDGSISEDVGGPVFKPPTGRVSGPGSDFTCDYSKMVGWTSCSTADNRGCWLKNKKTGAEYNITTNYEDTAPTGTTRNYVLNVDEAWVNADGMNFTDAKIFNGIYPGPWLQACWGDVSILSATPVISSLASVSLVIS